MKRQKSYKEIFNDISVVSSLVGTGLILNGINLILLGFGVSKETYLLIMIIASIATPILIVTGYLVKKHYARKQNNKNRDTEIFSKSIQENQDAIRKYMVNILEK